MGSMNFTNLNLNKIHQNCIPGADNVFCILEIINDPGKLAFDRLSYCVQFGTSNPTFIPIIQNILKSIFYYVSSFDNLLISLSSNYLGP